MFFFFFFQAEDGIRDLTVTGVQTCALPIWSRFHGGRVADHADGVAVDTAGFIYVTGQTDSDNFPAGPPGVVQPFLAGGQDAFVTKFRPDGAIVWSTYLGGGRDDFGT